MQVGGFAGESRRFICFLEGAPRKGDAAQRENRNLQARRLPQRGAEADPGRQGADERLRHGAPLQVSQIHFGIYR